MCWCRLVHVVLKINYQVYTVRCTSHTTLHLHFVLFDHDIDILIER
jgi:hypothetical protein